MGDYKEFIYEYEVEISPDFLLTFELEVDYRVISPGMRERIDPDPMYSWPAEPPEFEFNEYRIYLPPSQAYRRTPVGYGPFSSLPDYLQENIISALITETQQ